jgi:hypothetical protein
MFITQATIMIVNISASTTQGYFYFISSTNSLNFLFRINLIDEELERAMEGCDIVRIDFNFDLF